MSEETLKKAESFGKEAWAKNQRMPIFRDLVVDLGKEKISDFTRKEREEILEAWFKGWNKEEELYRKVNEPWR